MEDRTSYIVSDSGIVVWKSPQWHPLLQHTNVSHPDFVRKATETFQRGIVSGLPKICSENSEDARTWLIFSPLLEAPKLKALTLENLLGQSFPETIQSPVLQGLDKANLYFWHGKKTPTISLAPPPSLPFKQGFTEVDLIVTVENEILVFIEAKYRSGVTPGVKYAQQWDQVIRNVDVGSWFARGRFSRFYFILLQYGDYSSNAESVLLRYRNKPAILRKALEHRTDLDDGQIEVLASSIAFTRWTDPMKQSMAELRTDITPSNRQK